MRGMEDGMLRFSGVTSAKLEGIKALIRKQLDYFRLGNCKKSAVISARERLLSPLSIREHTRVFPMAHAYLR